MKNVKSFKNDLTSVELDYFFYLAIAASEEIEGKSGKDFLEDLERKNKVTCLAIEELSEYIFENIKKGYKIYCYKIYLYDVKYCFMINDDHKMEYICDENFESLLGGFVFFKDKNYLIKQLYNKIKIFKKEINNKYFNKILSYLEEDIKKNKIDLTKEEENLTSCFSKIVVANTKDFTNEEFYKIDHCSNIFKIKNDKKSFKLFKKLIDNKTIFYYDSRREEFYFLSDKGFTKLEIDDNYYKKVFYSIKQVVKIKQ